MKPSRLLSILLLAILAGGGLALAVGLPPAPIIGALVVCSIVIPKQAGVLNVTLFDLAKPTGTNPGAGGGIKSSIILINGDDIDWDNFPSRTDGSIITANIPLKAGRFMHRFYMTQETIIPSQKLLVGGNKDCGGYEISLAGFFPGIGKAVQKWIANFGVGFQGLIIIENCSTGTNFLIGEPCNMVYISALDTVWGTDISKPKGTTFTFLAKQAVPMAFYEGAILYDPSSVSW